MDEEFRDVFKLTHIGKVVDNNDPEKRKRLKIIIDPWEYLEDKDLPWVKQAGDGSVGNSPDTSTHNIPEIGADVSVYFKNGDPEDPVYTGVETTESNKCSLFDEYYPNTYGKKDSKGNFEIHNKETGISVYHHNSGTEVQQDPDGSITITNPNGAYAHCDEAGNWKIYGPNLKFVADDTIEMQAANIKMQATKSLNIGGNTTQLGGVQALNLASGADILIGSKSGGSLRIGAKEIVANGLFRCSNGANGTIINILSGKPFIFANGILIGSDK